MTDNDSLTVTYRKRTFIITKCHHEAEGHMDNCYACMPNWRFICLEVVDTGGWPDRSRKVKPSIPVNRKVMALPEVLAFTGEK